VPECWKDKCSATCRLQKIIDVEIESLAGMSVGAERQGTVIRGVRREGGDTG
jgi:hypothetical protein